MDPESYLPLTPPVFQVLLALADGEKHGYAILKEVDTRSNGAVRLSTGTLYAIIKRLLTDGAIEETASRIDGDDERRRYYRLTTLGRRIAAAEASRMADLVTSARRKRLIGKPRLA